MKILIGVGLMVLSASMRSWGRRNYYKDDTLKPFYQTWPTFWFLFALWGMGSFFIGIILLLSGIVDAI